MQCSQFFILCPRVSVDLDESKRTKTKVLEMTANILKLKMMTRSSSGQIIKIIALTSLVWLVLDFALFYSTGFMSSNYDTVSDIKMPIEEIRKPRLEVFVDDYGDDDGLVNLNNLIEDNLNVSKNHKNMLDLLKRQKENGIDVNAEEITAERWVGNAQLNNNGAVEYSLLRDDELKRQNQIHGDSFSYEKVN